MYLENFAKHHRSPFKAAYNIEDALLLEKVQKFILKELCQFFHPGVRDEKSLYFTFHDAACIPFERLLHEGADRVGSGSMEQQ